MFGWGKKKPEKRGKVPTFDEEYDDDFGYGDADPGTDASIAVPRDDLDPPSEIPDTPSDTDWGSHPRGRKRRPAGRATDDATVVPQHRSSAPPEPPPPADDEFPDETCFIEAPVAAGIRTVGWLVVTHGSTRGTDHRLNPSRTRIGTGGDCEIKLAGDQYASSTHAEIIVEGDRFVLRDLNSTNGTFRNDERVKDVHLADGDRLRLGTSQFIFKSVRL